ncbi:MAG: membrane protein insertion efficiency factor YidD [Chloroflexi bacterium]|nr:membrane protein insertion efficiency factor YidD [Chloroflexota bacterium]
MTWITLAPKWIGLFLIRLYQLTLSHMLPAACRFEPTCSHYGYEAIDRYGLWKGGRMAAGRIARCHPFNPGGYDPVP